MNAHHRKLIKNFFSDYLIWLLTITFFLLVTIVMITIWDGSKGYIWALLVIFVLIYSSNSVFFKLYFAIRKDFKKNVLQKQVITIDRLVADPKLNFRKGTGATMGKAKYQLIDDKGNYYLLSSCADRTTFKGFQPFPKFKLEVEYLENCRFVLQMNILTENLGAKDLSRQETNISHLKEVFPLYF